MKPIVLAALLAVAPPALSDDWVALASDALNSTYLNAASLTRDAAGVTRFRIKLVYNKRRDMMGLRYDIATKDYEMVCDSNVILSRQHALLDGDEIVWTFPPSRENVKADAELPAEVLGSVCR